ncbi:hypothetical protein [Elizabethkingia meningoseptica]|uniref:hypothetical protein n=1 Tax=Elizabethkingia meningoseptica TaxID=238 RepID=UPI003891F6E5
MKSNELRIGNYVEYAGVICKVEGYSNEGLETNGVVAPISAYNPIQLTEELLLKLEFKNYEKVSVEKYVQNLKFSFPIDIPEIICLVWQIIENEDDIIELHNIKYLHQLQNLYFSLTGEELTIKE